MESPAVGLLPGKRPADGFDSEKRKRLNVVDYSNPCAISDLLDSLNHGKFGSVTKHIESLIAKRMQRLSHLFAKDHALLQSENVGMNRNEEAAKEIIDLEDNLMTKTAPKASSSTVVIIDSDEEDDRDMTPCLPFQEVILPKPVTRSTTRDIVDMLVLKRGRGGKSLSVTSHDNTNSRGTCSTPQSRHVISPLSLQQQLEEMPINSPPTPHTQNSSAGSSTAINKCRGVYKSINLNLRTAQGAKIRVKFLDSMSRAIGPEARDFSNYCGLTLRTTVSFRDYGGSWKNIFKKYGHDMILKIKDKFEPVDVITEEKFHIAISIILQNTFRNWKNNLHSHYKKYETDEDRLADPPQTISFQDWEWLLIYFKSDMFKNKSVRNTINREKQMTKHTCGPQSFAEIEYATRDPTTGRPIPLDQLWEITHTRKTLDGQVVWADPHSKQLHSRMHEIFQQQDQDLDSDARMTPEEILSTVLGERSGYIRGKGYGAKPSRKRNRPQSTDSSVVESVHAQLQEEFDKKFQDEREKLEAERAVERAKIEEERENIQQERVQFEQRLMEQMEQRIQVQFAALMQKRQPYAATSSSHSIRPST